MRILIIILLTGVFSLSAQNTDYNTKKGFAAEGYDVVAYFSNRAIEGDNKFNFKFDDVNYKFSSEENLNRFKENPEKYIPEYGGYCAYAVAIKGKKVSVDPKTFEIIDGKLYLFYNSWGTNTLELWNKSEDVKVLIDNADKKWEAIKMN